MTEAYVTVTSSSTAEDRLKKNVSVIGSNEAKLNVASVA